MDEADGVKYSVSGVVQGEVVPVTETVSSQVDWLGASFSSNWTGASIIPWWEAGYDHWKINFIFHLLKMIVILFWNILFEKLRDILELHTAVLRYVPHRRLYDVPPPGHPLACQSPAVREGNLPVLPEPSQKNPSDFTACVGLLFQKCSRLLGKLFVRNLPRWLK